MHELKKNWEEKVILLCEIFYSAINEVSNNLFEYKSLMTLISLIESDTISIGQLIMTQKSPGTES